MKINKRNARGKERVHSQDARESGVLLTIKLRNNWKIYLNYLFLSPTKKGEPTNSSLN